MPTLTVGPTSTFPTIAAAMAAATAGDTILLQSGYSNETATVTHSGMIVSGDATSTGIVLHLAAGDATFTLAGTAPINVLDAATAADGNNIVGNGGNNVITVSEGADAVSGGLGTDRLVVDYHLATGAITGDSTSNFAEAGGGARLVTVNGGFENFTVFTGAGADTLTTGAGDDIIHAGDGANTVTAGQGANVIVGGANADTITALDGGNSIDGGDGANVLTSGSGNDTITGGVGADTIVAGGGNDLITVRGGGDTVHGDAGTDRLVVNYSGSSTVVTMVAPGGSLAAGHSGGIADVSGNSTIFDGIEHFTITGGSAGDVLTTGGGNDLIAAGAGNDTVNAGQGNDVITDGAGNDTSTGGLGADRFVYAPGNDADVVTDFGVGVDKLDFSAFTSIHSLADLLALTTQVGADTRIDFGSGDSVTLLNVARSALSAGDFTFAAAPPPPPPPDDNHAPVNGFHDATTAENKMAVASTASTDADHDALTYKISGGADAAFFVIDPNTHALSFKAGQDFESPDSSTHSNKYHLTVQVSDGEDTVGRDITVSVGNVNGETVKGNHGNNRIDSIHTVRGQHLPGGEEDTISGKHGNDRISGLGGNDHLTGGSGNDRLSGNDGIDALKGGKGADRLAGGLGNDLLNGGQGKDSFVFNTALANNVDTIKHFNAHDDKILLQDAVFTGLSGSGKLGSGEFHAGAAAHDANDHIIYNAKTGALLYDADGTGGIAAVRFAQISGHHSLDHSDFLVI